MTNSAYTKLLQRCTRAYNRYDALYEMAREEYIRRYGESPGEHDNDQWIDSIEGGNGIAVETITSENVDEWAVACGRESILSNAIGMARRDGRPPEEYGLSPSPSPPCSWAADIQE